MGSGDLLATAATTSGFPIGVLWTAFLDLLRIIVWPGALLLVFYFFRRVFAYFLLSLHEINIFGAGVKLVKDPMQVVAEMVEKRFAEEKKVQEFEELRKKEIAHYETQIQEMHNKNVDLEVRVNAGAEVAKDILDDLKQSNDENTALRVEIERLKGEMSAMEGDAPRTVSIPARAPKKLLLDLKKLFQDHPGDDPIQLNIGGQVIPLPLTVTYSEDLEEQIRDVIAKNS